MRHRTSQSFTPFSVETSPSMGDSVVTALLYDGNKLTVGLTSSDTMDDDDSKSRNVKECVQYKARASVIVMDGERYRWRNYAGYPIGGLGFTCTTHGITVLPTANAIPGNVPWSDMAASLSEKLQGRIRSKSLLAVTVRELPSTIGMVRNPFRILRGDWRKLVGRKACKELSKEGANLWLEYQYGWKALQYDLSNFADSYARILSVANALHQQDASSRPFDENRTVLGIAPYEQLYTDQEGNFRTGRLNIITKRVLTEAKLFCRARAARSDLSHLDYVLNSLGLDNRAMLNSLWEIIPFSFVADWFIKLPNIMAPLDYSALQSQSILLGHQFKNVWEFQATFMPGILDTYWSTGYWDWELTSPPLKGSLGYKTEYHRAPGLPSVEGVQLSKDLSSTQLKSLGSLLIQAATTKPRWLWKRQ